MPRSSARSRPRRVQRRRLVWARNSIETTITTGGGNVPHQNDLLSGFNTRYGADAVGLTIVRIRGIIGVSGTVAGLPAVLAVRTGTEGEVAAAAFNPMTDGEYNDWMMYEPFIAFPDNANATASTDITARVIDVKSMRKLDELDQTLFLYAGSDTATASTVTLRYNLSVLLMLP